jgi:hypothetical protein
MIAIAKATTIAIRDAKKRGLREQLKFVAKLYEKQKIESYLKHNTEE